MIYHRYAALSMFINSSPVIVSLSVEIIRQLIQFFPVVRKDLRSFLMLLFHQFYHLTVDLRLCFRRGSSAMCRPPRYWLFTVSIATISKSLLMPVSGDHRPGKLGRLLDIIGSAGG